jgi:hypothetical protein
MHSSCNVEVYHIYIIYLNYILMVQFFSLYKVNEHLVIYKIFMYSVTELNHTI